jgi:hypothetical protein
MRNYRILSAEEAQECLAPFALGLRESVEEAFGEYVAAMPAVGPISSRTRAGILHDFTVRRLGSRWPDRMLEAQRRTLLRLRPDILLQVKKLDEDRLPQNYPTPTAQMFASQLSLAGLPPATRLTLGYRLNSLGTDLREITVLCTRNLRRATWYYDLTDLAAPIKQLPLPVQPTKRRLTAKRDAQRDKKKSEDGGR